MERLEGVTGGGGGIPFLGGHGLTLAQLASKERDWPDLAPPRLQEEHGTASTELLRLRVLGLGRTTNDEGATILRTCAASRLDAGRDNGREGEAGA